jgi:hypothetical protein
MQVKKERVAPLKTCPGCEAKIHTRKSQCSCGFSFYKKKRKKTIEDWQSLKKGDIIRSVYGNGPYWEDPNTQEKQYMGSYGKFIVDEVGSDYIRCYEVVHRGIRTYTGTHVLYMGNCKKSELCDNVYKCPHKLVRVSLKGGSR